MFANQWQQQVLDHLESKAELLRAKRRRDGGKLDEQDLIRLETIEKLLAQLTQEFHARREHFWSGLFSRRGGESERQSLSLPERGS